MLTKLHTKQNTQQKGKTNLSHMQFSLKIIRKVAPNHLSKPINLNRYTWDKDT